MRYIVYVRKSSESEDRQVFSLKDQKSVLKQLATSRNLTVVKTLEESKSAKDPGVRPEFDRLLALIELGKADAILCWNVNRLTRNPIDGGRIAWLLQRGILQEILTPDRCYRPADNALLLAVETGVANQYILDLSKNVKRGLSEKARRGWYPGKPPPGYKTDPDSGETLPDGNRFVLMRNAWRTLVTTSASASEVYKDLMAAGLTVRYKKSSRPLTRSGFYRLLSNPFYYGDFSFNGEIRQGNHEPMVSRADFERVQERIGRAPYVSAKHTFAYTGLITCGTCGCQITAERKAKGNPKLGPLRLYTYYHCTGRRGCPRDSVTEEDIDRQMTDLARSCTISNKLGQHLAAVCQRVLSDEPRQLEARLESQRKRRESIRLKLTNLLDLRLTGEISKEEYASHRAELTQEVHTIESSIARTEEAIETIGARFASRLHFASSEIQEFPYATNQRKSELAGSLADSYVLKAGRLEMKLDPIMGVIQMFEPQKGRDYMVRATTSKAPCPIERAVRDAIRTLLLEGVDFM
jgi:DNA invertase Pin-like site-specific DNA recombinase